MDPRTRLVRLGMPAIAAGIVIGATLPAAVSGISAAAGANASALPWLFERLFAFLAYLALTASVVYGLLLSTKILDAIAHRPVSFTLHQDLAAIGLGMAGIHGALLGLDASMPFSLAQIAVPGLAPYAPLAVGVGQAAFYLAAVVTASFYVRARIGQRAWRALHYVTFLAFAGATVHGIAAGTDSGQGWAQGLYIGALTLVSFLLTYRILVSVLERLAPAREPEAPSSAVTGRSGPSSRRQRALRPGRDTL